MDVGGLIPAERHVDRVVEMMLDAIQNYATPLTTNRLFGWHAALFPTGRSGMDKIVTGAWRNQASGPMQVVFGAIGRERVHFAAPAADILDAEMSTFHSWFEGVPAVDPVLMAAIAHLWFVTIHPFDDGSGRIARAIAYMALARSEGSPQRFYSLSAQIRAERNNYYVILEQTQKGTMDISEWLAWFLACLNRAIEGAETILEKALIKGGFWDLAKAHALNDRQHAIAQSSAGWL